MFTRFRRFRRQVAVLTALSLVAGALVAAAPAAAADPKADFTATFDACLGAPSADFTDVPAGHANAGDIDCIAYYGVTKGTSATTYSPLRSVTREHMALFLTRLARLVGIEVSDTPGDPGFRDIADLSAESQTAIAQLADLGITRGTSAVTYSPAANVKRGHMALFLSRLMDKMTASYGYLPSDVEKNKDKHTIGSPFTDLGSATLNEFDAITHLWELGVVSGISDTVYSPGSDITRSAMAEFMAALMDHANVRPAGLSIQASETTGFGSLNSTVMVSYRTDGFVPVENVSVDIFSSEAESGGLNSDGQCIAADVEGVDGAECEQDGNDPQTDESGNIIVDSTTDQGNTEVYYAWTGESGDRFDRDDVDEVTVSITARNDTASLKITSTISEHADQSDYDSTSNNNPSNTVLEDGDGDADEPRVYIGATSSVRFTVQLQDSGGKNVAKPDADVTVRVVMAGKSTSDNTYTLRTDRNGRVTYTVNAPGSSNGDDRRLDILTFDADGAGAATKKILWLEDGRARTKAVATVGAPFAVITSGVAKVTGRVSIYDQYGSLHRVSGQQVNFAIPSGADAVTKNAAGGRASHTGTDSSPTAGDDIQWSALIVDDNDSATNEPTIETSGLSVLAVTKASDGSTSTGNVTVYADHDKFVRTDTNVLYSYDSGDSFLSGGKRVTLDEFEVLLGRDIDNPSTAAQVNIISYAEGGTKMFHVTRAASA